MKRFDDYNVECNDCVHYWDDSCSGTQVGTTKECRDYKATRKVDIPNQIKALEKRIDLIERNRSVVIVYLGIILILQVLNLIF